MAKASYEALQAKIEKMHQKREKQRCKKPIKVSITIPKGSIANEAKAVIQAYASELLADDYDWDYSYLLRMMIFKLSRMRKCLGKGWSADRNNVADQILEVEKALERIDEDDYGLKRLDLVYKKHDVKHGFKKDKEGRTLFSIIPRKKNGTFDQKAYDDDVRTAIKEGEDERQRDLSIAFDGMKKNILGWWD